jgi:hypothetical protein
MTRLTAVLFFCLVASSAWAVGIKHPSDYGDPSTGITFTSCGSQQNGLVIGDCFEGTGAGSNDFLFSFDLASPSASTSITSVTFNLTDVPSDFGLLEGDATDCASMNIACTPAQVTINDGAALAAGPNTFTFTNFTGNLTVTEYFSYSDPATAPSFTDATTSSITATPEPSEIAFLLAAIGSTMVVRRRQQAKQNS